MTLKVVSLWVIFRDVDTLLKSGGGAFDGSFSQKKTRGAHGTFYFKLAKKAGVDILQKKPKNAPTGKNSAPAKFPKLSNISIIKWFYSLENMIFSQFLK